MANLCPCISCGKRVCELPADMCPACVKLEDEMAAELLEDEPDFDPENIYNVPSMRQSIEEDRARRRR